MKEGTEGRKEQKEGRKKTEGRMDGRKMKIGVRKEKRNGCDEGRKAKEGRG